MTERQQEAVQDLELLKLFRQEESNFKKHLELKENEILNLKRRTLISRTCVDCGTQTEQDKGAKEEDGEDIQLKVVNDIFSVGSDSVPFFHSLLEFKSWIAELQKSHSSPKASPKDRMSKSQSTLDSHRQHVQVETQTDKYLALSLLSLFAKQLNKTKKTQTTAHNQNLKDISQKYNNALRQLEYQMQVNADMKRLIVDSVIGNQVNSNYTFWGSDPDIQMNILELYNDALVKIGNLNHEIDTLKSQNLQLNQIVEEFLMATIE